MSSNDDRSRSTDGMISRLESDIEERSAFIEGLVAAAQEADRDLTDTEKELSTEARKRIESCEQQLETLYENRTRMASARKRYNEVSAELAKVRHEADSGTVEYRSAGEWALDSYKAHIGDRDAKLRLEAFHRAADHQKTPDNLGVVPDPIVGDVVNFIDAARPIVSFIGPMNLPAATWHRPKVTQHTSVATQGAAGEAADEKSELVSQKMVITRLTANAVTYGGYVNVSRQNIDFSQPSVLDLVINDLAAQYAIETEAAAAAAIAASTGPTSVLATDATADDVAAAVWLAASNVYTAVKGQGRLLLAIAPSRLAQFGPLFDPVNPRDSQSPGMEAGRFGQGVMGTISGVPVVMSAGAATDAAALFSTSALEVFEQRVGTLQVTEPSVLGVQVAYAGYFTPLTIEDNGIHRFTPTA